MWEKAKLEKLPFIIFSTYHSAEKFAESGIVPNLTIHDEAHNLVSSEFCKAASLPCKRDLYFTATEKVTDSAEDVGMNNEAIFGRALYTKTAKEMISVGEMLPPYIHVVKSQKGQIVDLSKLDRDYDALIHSIIDAFEAHQKKLNEVSYNSDEIGAKVLVVCRGYLDLQGMFDSKMFETLRKDHADIHIYALSSEFGLYFDGVKIDAPVTNIKKFKFIKSLKNLKANERCIIFHVDMIGEGIDVPGITGVMPFRNCELSKFVQNIGRASRLHKKDRERLYSEKISPSNRSEWIKPYSWVIVPSFLENSEGWAARAKEIVHHLRNDFGYIPQQHTVIDNGAGDAAEVEIEITNDPSKEVKSLNSGLDQFSHEFENMTEIERAIYDDSVEGKKAVIDQDLSSIMGI